MAAITAAAGNVMIQAITIFVATSHLTAETLRAAPTPITDPVTVWVVDTGMPEQVAANSMIAPAVVAQLLCTGVSRVIFDPTVCTMRHPPTKVPSPMAAWHVMTTQNGT